MRVSHEKSGFYKLYRRLKGIKSLTNVLKKQISLSDAKVKTWTSSNGRWATDLSFLETSFGSRQNSRDLLFSEVWYFLLLLA